MALPYESHSASRNPGPVARHGVRDYRSDEARERLPSCAAACAKWEQCPAGNGFRSHGSLVAGSLCGRPEYVI